MQVIDGQGLGKGEMGNECLMHMGYLFGAMKVFELNSGVGVA